MIPAFFNVNHGLLRYLVSALLMCNTTILVFLSYRYMVMTFALSFFFSILAIYFLWQEDNKLSVIGGSICIICSLSLYQANVSCTAVLVILLLIDDLLSGKKYKDIGRFLLKSILSFILSCILYKLLWSLVMKLFNITTVNYNGSGTVSISGIISAMPSRIAFTYQAFRAYFFTDSIYFNVYQRVHTFFSILLLVFFICYLLKIISNLLFDSYRTLFALVLTALIPIASNISSLLAPDSGFIIQMTMGMAMLLPLCFLIISKPYEVRINRDNDETIDDSKSNSGGFHRAYFIITGLIFIILLYGNLLMVSVDQHTMLQGKAETLQLMNRIVSDVEKIDDIEDKTVYFAGEPASNPMFAKDKNFQYSNSYARYGEIWLDGACLPLSYHGLLRDLGANLNLERDYNKYHKIIESDEVRKMPVYPEEGSIKDFNGKVIIKVSEDY